LTTLIATGQLLASQPSEDLVLNYVLLPYGQEGSTNLGKLTASHATLTLPQDPSNLGVNLEHDPKAPVGMFASLEDKPDQLLASVRFLPTTAGRDAYTEAKMGARKGISVEVANPVIRQGKLLAGELSGAGVCVKPAYPAALMVASDHGDLPAQAQQLADDAQALADALAPEDPNTNPDSQENKNVPAPAVQAAAPAAAAHLTASTQVTEPLQGQAPAGGAVRALAATLQGLGSITNPTLMAANLDTITQADIFDKASTPTYVGELWQGRGVIQRFAPLVTPAELTSMTITGWEFTTGKTPTVGDWAPAFSGTIPNETMNDIPTNEVAATQVSYTASRIAGGHRIDRIHTDLPTPGFWEAYLRESTDDFARKLDAKVGAHLLANGTAKTATGADAASAWARLVFAASWCLDYAVPTYAVVGNDLYRELLNTTALENLSMLNASLGLEEGQLSNFKIVGAAISDATMTNKVIVGSGAATHLHTLPGGPVRVDGVEVQKGAMDHGVFGYYALRTADARGIIVA
jgi:hypothetical protein